MSTRDEIAKHWNSPAVVRLRIKVSRIGWVIDNRLMSWADDLDPCDDYAARLLAQDDWGDWVVPAGLRDGEPYWQGIWRRWKPTHWPAYFRSRRRRAFVYVEWQGADA